MSETLDVIEEVVEAAPKGYGLGSIFGGAIVGIGLGAAGGYFFAKRQLETKYNEIAADEIAEMREDYRAKVIAMEGAATKPKLEALIRDKGYSGEEPSSQPPMAVEPPASVVEAAQEEDPSDTADAKEDETRERTENVFEKQVDPPKFGWNYEDERARRSHTRPYVIHRDEKDEEGVYEVVTWTYYEADDVVCNERDEVIGEPERNSIVGDSNIERFGHGSDDPNIVFIRNDRLEMVIELCRSPQSYAEEVHGFQHSDETYPRQRRKVRFDDDE